MQVQINEFKNDFNIELEPETLEEASILLRLSANSGKKVSINFIAFEKAGLQFDLYFRKRKGESSSMIYKEIGK